MLYRVPGDQVQGQRALAGPAGSEFIGFSDVRSFLARHFLTIVGSLMIATLIGTVHVLTAKPQYTAFAQLVIDPDTSRAFREQAGASDGSLDNAKVESQIEFLRSERIAISVINALGLTRDPEFLGSSIALLANPAEPRQSPDRENASEFEQLRNAIANFSRKLYVRRVGQSYMIEVAFTSVDPEKAARIANATANAYIADQLEAKAQAARRGGQWLEERIAELRKQLNTAARAAQEFKAQNNIVDAGNRGLLDDQQLSELNSQLVLARVRSAEMRARLEQIRGILAVDVPDGAVMEALGNQLINVMQERYLNAAARLTELMSRYRADHPAVVNLTAEMKEQKRAMQDELRRIAEVYKSDAEVARLRETQLSQEMEKRIEHAAATKEAQITAAELDTVALTLRRLYESYLQTLAEAVQRESFPVSDARVISSASKPLGKSSPRSKLVVAVSVLAGAIAGIGLAVLRQSLDRSVRSPRQLRRELDVECLGLVPLVREERWKTILKIPSKLLRKRPRAQRSVIDVEEHTASVFSGAMLGVKTSIELAGQIQSLGCVAITSLSPGEGKSTVAYNLAKLFALCGTRTLLIDGNLHLDESRDILPGPRKGLLDVLQNTDLLPEAKISNKRLPLDVLPYGNRLTALNSCGLLGSEGMRQVLDVVRKDYGIVIVDLPSLKVSADARAISPCVDGLIMVAEAGKTPTDILGESMQDLAAARANILGVVLNKVDERPLRRHGNLAAAYYT